MSVFIVETYVVRAEKRAEFEVLLQGWLEFKKRNADLFAGLKSWKLYRQEFGAIGGMYIEMKEFEDLAEMERIRERIYRDAGMIKIQEGFHLLIEPATFSTSLWVPVA